jgi:O-antigen/teichoic acid export membrane protein
MIATLAGALVMALAAPFLCITIFGEAFAGSVDDLRILAFGAFGIAALKLLGNALVAQGKPMLQTIAAAASFFTIIALDIILIPNHGGTGAAIASTIAYSVGGIAVVILFARALGARWSDLVPRPSDVTNLVARVRGVIGRRRPTAG